MRLTSIFRLQLLAPVAAMAALSSTPSQAQVNRGGYVVTDKSALLEMPPARVSDDAFSLTWAPDSARLITINIRHVDTDFNPYNEDHIPRESDLVIGRWNRLSHFADVVWKRRYSSEPMPAGDPAWIPGTQIVLQTVFWQEKEVLPDPAGSATPHINLTPCQELLWINAARSAVREIKMEQGDAVSVSPTRSLAVIVSQNFYRPNRTVTVTPVRVDGTTGTPVELPMHTALGGTQWTTDGSRMIITMLAAHPANRSARASMLLYDPKTGEIKPNFTPKPDAAAAPGTPRKYDIVLKSTIQHLESGDADVVTRPLWAETVAKSEKTSMLISPDADDGKLSPDGTAVAYRSHGSSWVSEIKPMPLDEFKALVAKAKRAVQINNAKQLGLAAIMWATDHDDMLPGPDNINTELFPYLNTDQLFGQFNYTYPGGPLSAIASPAETVLGTVDGPDGQAVIYSDGHVKWRNR